MPSASPFRSGRALQVGKIILFPSISRHRGCIIQIALLVGVLGDELLMRHVVRWVSLPIAPVSTSPEAGWRSDLRLHAPDTTAGTSSANCPGGNRRLRCPCRARNIRVLWRHGCTWDANMGVTLQCTRDVCLNSAPVGGSRLPRRFCCKFHLRLC